jgi:hypothetical protein
MHDNPLDADRLFGRHVQIPIRSSMTPASAPTPIPGEQHLALVAPEKKRPRVTT